MMVQIGNYNTLTIVKVVDFGLYLDGGSDEILLPKRYVPEDARVGEVVDVFVYHDNDGKLIATTDKPIAVVGEIAMMEVADTTPYGAFLRWGIMKDVFIPISLQQQRMRKGDRRLVKLFIDEQTGRVTATEKIDKYLSNYELAVVENEEVDLVVFQKTDIGYKVIINSMHTGVLHYNEVFQNLEIGDRIKGYVKTIRPGNKLDVAPGKKGYSRIVSEEDKVLEMLLNNDGYLPYNDKSKPEDIYAYFGMSKKAFKMLLGALYKKRLIEFTQTGMKLVS